MKILFCDNRLGGLLGFRVDVIHHLVEHGHEVVLVAPFPETEWDRIGKIGVEGTRVEFIPMQPSGFNPFADLALLGNYRRLFRKERPDIIFTYTIKPNIYAGIAASWLHIRTISMIAGLGYAFEGNGFFKSCIRTLYRYGLRKAEKVLTLNHSNYDCVLSHNMAQPDRILRLSGGEGVNLDEYPPTKANFKQSTTFLVISRLLYDKGYQEFVSAAKVMKKKHRNVHFEWLGPTAYDRPFGVPKEVFMQHCKERVYDYIGVTHDVQKYLGREDVVMVLPSYMEGMSRSLMEACSMGRPIITTDAPGCREAVDNGVNGWIIPKQHTQALIDAMERFLALPEAKKQAMAQSSRKIAQERFNIKNVIELYDQLLKSDE